MEPTREEPFRAQACPVCGASLRYSETHDAVYCPVEDEWREAPCWDPICSYCRKRPARPSESQPPSNRDTTELGVVGQ